MSVEVMEVLKKVQSKELSLEEGLEMLQKDDSKKEVVKKQKSLRIKVLSSDGDKVNVQLPLSLMKVLNLGKIQEKVLNSTDNNFINEAIDFEKIYEMIEDGMLGELVDVESADGDIVKVYFE